MTKTAQLDLKSLVKDVPDFPQKGIIFKDITPLLAAPKAFDDAITRLAAPYQGKGVKAVAGIESRGFLLAAGVALKLGAGVVPIRKKGKLPRATHCESYDLEYGKASIEAHQDAFARGDKVVLVDDVLATGGTAAAALRIIERIGARVVGVSFLIELGFLHGRDKVKGYAVDSLISY
ncbi:MAG: adenine phosphoribosyltransferase [Elusimicrobia bacterium]|nr:adenine phosphoribosyltransferase [Elusimicrobiota bacterium]